MTTPSIDIQADLTAIGRISVIPSILEVICRTTGMGFAAVARVTDKKWVACAVRDEIAFGLIPGAELMLETTICNEIRQHHLPVVIDHVEKDERYAGHHTPAMYGFQSYISVPIKLKNGQFFGTLCAIDPRPAKLNNVQTIQMFHLYTELIAFHLHDLEQLELSQNKLSEELKNAELREQFIAILGHDLRNPITAISNSAQLLKRIPLNERVERLAEIIHSSSSRITGLIENMLDFARGKLGGGIVLNRKKVENINLVLEQVIAELNTAWHDRVILTNFDFSGGVDCDEKRIAQLFSNLLGNALMYGLPEAPIIINATTSDKKFILSIANQGKRIPSVAISRLFQPFSRGETTSEQNGLGLGLFIASEIAKAHGGTLDVVSNDAHTQFTLAFPI